MIFEQTRYMRKIITLFIFVLSICSVRAQDSLMQGTVNYTVDPRLEVLGTKMAEYNEALANSIARTAKGYRLMLLSTNNRNDALNLRTQLLQLYPEHKVYMIYKAPFIKIKFGNFIDKKDAEKMRKQLNDTRVVTGNIYILTETIEVKPEKPATEE